MSGPFVHYLMLKRDQVKSWDEYSYDIPAIRSLDTLELHPKGTYFLGENGSVRSTLLEAIACADGFNPEGGSRNFNFTTRETHSEFSGADARVGRAGLPVHYRHALSPPPCLSGGNDLSVHRPGD